MNTRPQQDAMVLIIDDDEAVREGLAALFRSVGLQVTLFASAAEFRQTSLPEVPSCLVLDIRLPGLGGLEFQADLARANIQIPIIFMTGHGDIPMSVRAMKAGAVEFLTKPFRDQDMLDAVQLAIEQDRRQHQDAVATFKLKASFETLSPREQQIMSLVAAGLMNKQIAAEIGVSEVTVKVHRGSVMRKMGAKSIADLVRMSDALGTQAKSK